LKSSEYISQNQLTKLVIEALTELHKKGYTLEFRRESTCIYCCEWQQWIMPASFKVDESYRFEEIQAPDTDRMLYAISLSQGGRGFLIDTCTVYMDNISPEMSQKLNRAPTDKNDLAYILTMNGSLNSPRISLTNKIEGT
jgi:hypothetical protein